MSSYPVSYYSPRSVGDAVTPLAFIVVVRPRPGPAALPVRRAGHVVFRRRLEVARESQVLLHYVVVELEAYPGCVGYMYVAIVDDRLVAAFHQVLPPGHIRRMEFLRHKVRQGGRQGGRW